MKETLVTNKHHVYGENNNYFILMQNSDHDKYLYQFQN
jgi:hypothetical protein